jgi:hypothetical protein
MADPNNNVSIGNFKLELDSSELDVAMAKADKLKATLHDIKALQIGAAGAPLTDAQIRHMVEQFLRWKLPTPWHPDGGISFEPTWRGLEGAEHPREPTGTNLFDYTQARAMILHMLDGLPAAGEQTNG